MNVNPSSKSKIENPTVRKISHPLIQKTNIQNSSTIPVTEKDNIDSNITTMMENKEVQKQNVNEIENNNNKIKQLFKWIIESRTITISYN